MSIISLNVRTSNTFRNVSKRAEHPLTTSYRTIVRHFAIFKFLSPLAGHDVGVGDGVGHGDVPIHGDDHQVEDARGAGPHVH